MLISGAEAIRDVILFPTLRPEGREGADGSAAVASEGAPSAADFAAPGADATRSEQVCASLVDGSAHRTATGRCGGDLPAAVSRRRVGPSTCAGSSWSAVLVAIFSPAARRRPRSASRSATSPSSTADDRSAGLIIRVAIGLGIIGIARGLSRGKRRAWAVGVVLFALAALVHLLRGPDPIAVVLSAAMLFALIWFRDDFRAHSRSRLAAAGRRLRPRLPALRLPLHLDHAVRRAHPHQPRPDLLGQRRNRLPRA